MGKSVKREEEQTQPTQGKFPTHDIPASNSAPGLSPLKHFRVSKTRTPPEVNRGSSSPSSSVSLSGMMQAWSAREELP